MDGSEVEEKLNFREVDPDDNCKTKGDSPTKGHVKNRCGFKRSRCFGSLRAGSWCRRGDSIGRVLSGVASCCLVLPRVVWCYLVRVYGNLRVIWCCLVPPRVGEFVSYLLAV